MGQWVAVRHGFLLPARVVMAVFRGKMLDAIRRAVAREELTLPETLRPQQWVNLLTRLGHPTKTRRAGSMGGLSNQSLELTPGSAVGARGLVVLRPSGGCGALGVCLPGAAQL